MARPKSASHDLKRDEILDIAAQCFADSSYPATSMNTIAAAGGTSKARLYHYYDSKEAILFDLLDRYTQRLLALIGEAQAVAERRNLDDRAALHELIRCFLQEYENSATRHVALLSDTQFLGEGQRALIVKRQRDVVAAFTRFLKRAYPSRLNAANHDVGVRHCQGTSPAIGGRPRIGAGAVGSNPRACRVAEQDGTSTRCHRVHGKHGCTDPHAVDFSLECPVVGTVKTGDIG